MNHRLILLLLFCAISLVAPQAARAAISMDMVPIGNVGNANTTSHFVGATGFGGVNYAYSIGKYEVTVGQYTAFLNAVAVTDTYSLYNPSMATNLNIAGISQSGSSGSYGYSVIGSANKPVTYVNWGDSARFCNWLHNGQPTGLQDASTTERGAYTLDGATSDSALNAVSRNNGAEWFIPTENEWYKAAYHQPVEQGGDSDNYWDFPTGTNNEPNSDQPPGAFAIQDNVANLYRSDSLANGVNDGYAVSGSTSYSSSQNYLTDVGAYTGTSSFYGTFDQAGNVWEWNEALTSGLYRGYRGGAWNFAIFNNSLAGLPQHNDPTLETSTVGFRVATVPEPGTGALALAAAALTLVLRKRLR